MQTKTHIRWVFITIMVCKEVVETSWIPLQNNCVDIEIFVQKRLVDIGILAHNESVDIRGHRSKELVDG